MHIETAEIFSEAFARRPNLITGIEARTKLVFVITGLAINLLSTSVITPLCIAAACLIGLLSVKVPLKTLLLRLAMPAVMALVILVTQVFLAGGKPLFTLSMWGLSLTGYVEGTLRGLLIMCRVLGGVSLVLLLSLSTPADKLFLAAGWFKVPRIIIELALLIYRYIFVLAEEFITMREAQRVRLGYRNWRQSMRSLSTLGACLILRAYDRAERVFEAMLVRGYAGANFSASEPFSKKDGLVAVCLGAVLVMFYLTGRMAA
ncbi:MAG: cobalt ECF transporter T component CbiQ [Dehalococcoidales bacterium]|nr:cobalt ECF transporter T component CbiQ [Dehalococcoidales bacterium]